MWPVKTVSATCLFCTVILFLSVLAGCESTQTGSADNAPHASDPQIQTVMNEYIQQRIFKGIYYYYDPVEGRLLQLSFDHLDDEVQPKGNFFVSRAGFRDQFGRSVELHIFVMKGPDGFRVTQGLVRKIDDIQRIYDLESG